MITCRQLVELLIDFVSDELPSEYRALIEQHLSLCPPCVNYLETYRATIRLTRQLPCGELPPEFARRLREALGKIKEIKAPEPPADRPGAYPA